ncbi:MAG: alpha/beta hydrolase [Cyanothece sp. SIO1E1]|nr:alpha/beta hydrolase [Cyanothece sp. SIO1E1]
MFTSVLPAAADQLTESSSIELAGWIQRQAITTPLMESPIATAYVCRGHQETPILLLHGFDSSVFEFRRLLPLLAQRQRTWAVDLLGFGFTERPDGMAFDPTAIKTHLYSFWQALIGQPVILVGTSMGGAAAIDLALTYPDCVEKLVLVDSAGFAAAPVFSKIMMPPLDAWATAFLRNPGVRRRISEQAYCDRSLVTADAELCAALHLQLPGWQRALISFAKSGGYDFLTDKIARIQQPTLILWGEDDRILKKKDANKFKRAIASSRLIWIPNCGHVPHLEQPQIAAQYILDFEMSSRSKGVRGKIKYHGF